MCGLFFVAAGGGGAHATTASGGGGGSSSSSSSNSQIGHRWCNHTPLTSEPEIGSVGVAKDEDGVEFWMRLVKMAVVTCVQ